MSICIDISLFAQDSIIKKSGDFFISGKINHFDKTNHKFIELLFDDYFGLGMRREIAVIDTNGVFFKKVHLLYPQSFAIAFNKQWPVLLAIPDDTIFIEFDANIFPNKMHISGKYSDINNAYIHFKKEIEKPRFSAIVKIHNFKMEKPNSVHFKLFVDSLYGIRTVIDSKLIDSLNIRQLLKWSIQQNAKLEYYNDLLSFEHIYNYEQQYNRNKISANYKSIIDTMKIVPEYFLCSGFSTFINLAAIYLLTYSEIYRTNQFKIEEINPYVKSLSFLPSRVYKSLESVSDSLLKDLLLVSMANQYIKNKMYPVKDDLIYNYLKTPYIKQQFIESLNNKLKQDILSTELKLKFNPGEQVLEMLMKKYPDKIIYIDFWATWCATCYIDIEKSCELKKRLNSSDVIFAYLCCRSDYANWEKALERFIVIGDNILLNDEQFLYLSELFNFQGFPHYGIIGRNGLVIEKNASSPKSEKTYLQLKNLINKK